MIERKYDRLKFLLNDYGKVAVAFSGGVDSTFLLHVSRIVLGADRVVAFHVATGMQPPDEAESARECCDNIGVRFCLFRLDCFSWPQFLANPPERCYICKKKIFSTFLADKAVVEQGYALIDGTNHDDLFAERPGLKALAELGVSSPLAQAGLRKKEIRMLSKSMGLVGWDKPSASCLATRIPVGEQINEEKIRRVSACEDYLKNMGFAGVRVRLQNGMATVFVQRSDIRSVLKGDVTSCISDVFCAFGCRGVAFDPDGREDVEI